MRSWKPPPGRGGMWGAALLPRSFPHLEGRLDVSVPCAVALAFGRAISHDNSTDFFWSQTSAEQNAPGYFTAEGARVLSDSHHLRKLPPRFGDLESVPGGQSPRTQSVPGAGARGPAFIPQAAVCAQAQTTWS